MILNLTQHETTPEQKAAGVVDLPQPKRDKLIARLTFEEIPTAAEIMKRAIDIANLAEEFINGSDSRFAMIGGAPFLMSALENTLCTQNIKALYAFSKRVVEEETDKNGVVTKIVRFKHEGFVSS